MPVIAINLSGCCTCTRLTAGVGALVLALNLVTLMSTLCRLSSCLLVAVSNSHGYVSFALRQGFQGSLTMATILLSTAAAMVFMDLSFSTAKDVEHSRHHAAALCPHAKRWDILTSGRFRSQPIHPMQHIEIPLNLQQHTLQDPRKHKIVPWHYLSSLMPLWTGQLAYLI